MLYSDVILVGASSILANDIASTIEQDYRLIGVARKSFADDRFSSIAQADATDYSSLKSKLYPLLTDSKKIAVICGTGSFPPRGFLHNSNEKDYEITFETNVKVFLNLVRLF